MTTQGTEELLKTDSRRIPWLTPGVITPSRQGWELAIDVVLTATGH
jgi:hypothetical protein